MPSDPAVPACPSAPDPTMILTRSKTTFIEVSTMTPMLLAPGKMELPTPSSTSATLIPPTTPFTMSAVLVGACAPAGRTAIGGALTFACLVVA
jgi:hypothetical protein